MKETKTRKPYEKPTVTVYGVECESIIAASGGAMEIDSGIGGIGLGSGEDFEIEEEIEVIM